jgi:cell division initiation protein
MRMTPLEIQSHRFGRRVRGFDSEEVEAFLRMVTEDYESLLKENQSQRDRIYNLEQRLEELTSQEKLLKQTLLGAQAMKQDMRATAQKECEAVIGEAEIRAEKILDASHRRAARLAENIREMRGLRISLAEALRSSIDTHLGLIENLSNDPIDDALVDGMVEGKITYLSAAVPGHLNAAESKPVRATAKVASPRNSSRST